MTTSLRIIAVALGLLGVERIVYADIFSILPAMAEPTPTANVLMGSSILAAAAALFLGFGWARWPSVLGAVFVAIQGLAYVAWGLAREFESVVTVPVGLIEPVVAVVSVNRLVRHWPHGVTWRERLR